MKKILFLFVTAIISVSSLQAQKTKNVTDNSAGWQKIAEATVDFKVAKDKLTVTGTDNFKALRIKTTDAPIHIDNLIIIYESGDPENIPIRFDFKAGIESRAIELEGSERKLKEIDIIYRTIPNWKGDKAQVEIWGMK